MHEPDWKDYVPGRLGSRDMNGALLETDCPECGRHVGALVIDGPDPDFADMQCHPCGAIWNERVS